MTDSKTGIVLRGSVWMTSGGENLGGAGRIALLAAISASGSITKAAKSLGMSYKAAWDAIDTMNHLAGEPLVKRLAGGKGGGGTRLTPRGERLVANFQIIEREHRRFVDDLSRQADGITDDYLLVRRIGMKTSARNQFRGKVASLKRGEVNDEVELDVFGGERIVAVVTHESAGDLGLTPGAEAFALVKASSVIIVAGAEGARFSARNRFEGTVSRIQKGAVNTEVVLALPGGGSIAAVITNESAAVLDLAEGKPARAIFKASSVILGVPA